MEAVELLTTTRTVRKRLDLERPIPRPVVERCIRVSLQAPSGGNRRRYRYVLVDDASTRMRLADLYRKAFAEYRDSANVATNAFPERPEKAAGQHRVFDSAEHLANVLEDVPCLVVPCARDRLPNAATHHQQASYWGSLLPAIWSFMLAARTENLGTAWTTMHLRHEREAAEILGIDYNSTAQLALIPVAFTLGTRFRPATHEQLDSYLSWTTPQHG